MQSPFQVIALDDQRPGDLTLGRPLPGRPDVHQLGAGGDRGGRLVRIEPVQAGTGVRQQLIDGGEAGWLVHDAGRPSSGSVVWTDSTVRSRPPEPSRSSFAGDSRG